MTPWLAALIRPVAGALLLAHGAAGLAVAQQADPQPPVTSLTLDQLMGVEVQSVFGASRFLQKVIDAPATVSIITSDEIARFGYRTLADILRGVRGFYVSYDRNYSYVGVRGFARPGDYNTRLLLLIDGHRVNDEVYNQAPIGTEFPLDVDLIDRVEIVRGPSSSLYGTSAFFGVVNVITRSSAGAPGVSGSAEVGSFGTRRARATYARRSAGAAFLVSATASDSDGPEGLHYPEYDALPGGGTSAPTLDRDSFWDLYTVASKGGWTAHGLYASREKGIPTGAYVVALDDPRTQTVDTRGYLDVQYAGILRGTSVSWQGAYDRSVYDGTYAYLDEDLTRSLQIDTSYGAWWSTEGSLSRRIARAHLLTAGAELRAITRQDQALFFIDPFVPILDDRRESRVWAGYVQDELTISPKLLASGGLRYDHYDQFGGATTLRAALIFKPRPERALKLLHGTAFRAPNVFELHYYPAGVPHPSLDPETIRTTEIAWEQYIASRLRVSVAAFHTRVHDLISQVPLDDAVDSIGFSNVDRVRGTGVELEAEAAWASGPHALASYTFARTERSPGPADLTNSPRHLFRGRLTAPIARGAAFVGAEALYTGDRFDGGGGVVHGALIGNLTLTTRPIAKHLAVAFSMYNLFDRSYADPGAEEHLQRSIAQDGRTLRLRATWHF